MGRVVLTYCGGIRKILVLLCYAHIMLSPTRVSVFRLCLHLSLSSPDKTKHQVGAGVCRPQIRMK